jgi:NADP-dependent 3-hydroxy acid dehydrogenase YdfG
MQDLAGKTAFVTGGASGLGLSMVRAFSASGMQVAVADVEQSALDRVAAEFQDGQARILPLHVDVTDRAALAAAADETEAAFGPVHVVCNNAGVAVGGSIDQMTFADWDWVLGVNVDGVVNGIQTFLPRMLAHGQGGHFVNTASLAGQFAVPGLSVYNASKFAVVGLSEAMRLDLADKGIGVSVLCPGVVRTNIFDSGRNRPAALSRERDTAAHVLMSDVEDAERQARLEAILAEALDPALVGDMVVHGIRENELYIFTHPEAQPITDTRAQEIAGAFERWRAYRSGLDAAGETA